MSVALASLATKAKMRNSIDVSALPMVVIAALLLSDVELERA